MLKLYCCHLNRPQYASVMLFNRAENVSDALSVLRYLCFQVAQWLLAVAICNAVALVFCWKIHGLWHLILQISDIFQKKELQTHTQLDTECCHKEEM